MQEYGYRYTYKTTLRVIRRLCGGGLGELKAWTLSWNRLAPSEHGDIHGQMKCYCDRLLRSAIEMIC